MRDFWMHSYQIFIFMIIIWYQITTSYIICALNIIKTRKSHIFYITKISLNLGVCAHQFPLGVYSIHYYTVIHNILLWQCLSDLHPNDPKFFWSEKSKINFHNTMPSPSFQCIIASNLDQIWFLIWFGKK
jgi:hypothetical protein